MRKLWLWIKTPWVVIRTTWLVVIRGYGICDSCKQFVAKRKQFLQGLLCEPCHKDIVAAVRQTLQYLQKQKRINEGEFDV